MSGDVGRLIGGQERKCVGNILRLAQAAQRDPGDHRLDDLLGHRFHHISLRNPRSNRVHTDALGSQFAGQRYGQSIHRQIWMRDRQNRWADRSMSEPLRTWKGSRPSPVPPYTTADGAGGIVITPFTFSIHDLIKGLLCVFP